MHLSGPLTKDFRQRFDVGYILMIAYQEGILTLEKLGKMPGLIQQCLDEGELELRDKEEIERYRACTLLRVGLSFHDTALPSYNKLPTRYFVARS